MKLTREIDDVGNKTKFFVFKGDVGCKGELGGKGTVSVKLKDEVIMYDVTNRPEELKDTPILSVDDQSTYEHQEPVVVKTEQEVHSFSNEELCIVEKPADSKFSYETDTEYHTTPFEVKTDEFSLGDWEGYSDFEVGYCNGVKHLHDDFGKCTICGFQEYEEWELNSSNYSICGLNSLNTITVNIPQFFEVTGKKYVITSIAEETFKGCTLVSTINMPNSILTVGDNWHGNISSIRSITFSDNIRTSCNYFLPHGVAGAIYNYVFPKMMCEIKKDIAGIYDAKNNTHQTLKITLPDNLEVIENSAFKNCGGGANSGKRSLVEVTYQGVTYTSASLLEQALTNNGVEFTPGEFTGIGLSQ